MARTSDIMVAALLMLGASAAVAAPPTKRCPDGSTVKRNQSCPKPPPVVEPEPPVDPAPPVEPTNPFATVPSNFDVSAELVPAWGNGAIPVSASPDVVGAFRFQCMAGQVAWVDPIVNPGSKSAHLHQFFGNTAVKANSTYVQLRSEGDSTCMSALNRSGYWMPAMLNGQGQVVLPDFVTIYYKRRPSTDPIVSDPTHPQYQGKAVDLPNGLRFIFGYDMLTGKAPTGAAYFNCDGPGAVGGHYPDIPTAAQFCPTGTRIGAVINAPECWDGVNLDSPNHRDHVAYPGYGSWGYLKCPASHPYIIPTFTMGAWYSTDATLDRTGKVSWTLSSDAHAGTRPGASFHADWFGAWDNEVQAAWHRNCIDKKLNCSGGDLGNGKQLKQTWPFKWNAEPRLIPIPSGD